LEQQAGHTRTHSHLFIIIYARTVFYPELSVHVDKRLF